MQQIIQIECEDKEMLHATWFSATEKSAIATIIVGSAAAVTQKYYFGFCEFLAAHGFDVVSFDFRAIGQSKRRAVTKDSAVGFSTWIDQDYPAVIAYVKARTPNQKLLIVGHSAGGWMPGVSRSADQIDGILGVGALSGYWRKMARPQRYLHVVAWYLIIPIAIKIFGYWPGWAGLKLDLPKQLGIEFARWAKHPDFVFSEPGLQATLRVKKFTGVMHLFQFSDDPWGTHAAVADMARHYSQARSALIETITPQQSIHVAIGHFGFFRNQHRATLWPLALKRLHTMLE